MELHEIRRLHIVLYFCQILSVYYRKYKNIRKGLVDQKELVSNLSLSPSSEISEIDKEGVLKSTVAYLVICPIAKMAILNYESVWQVQLLNQSYSMQECHQLCKN